MPHATHASARNQDRDERLVELLHLNSRMEVPKKVSANGFKHLWVFTPLIWWENDPKLAGF